MPDDADKPPMSRLPSVDRLLRAPMADVLVERHGRTAVTRVIRETLDEMRGLLKSGRCVDAGEGAVLAVVADRLEAADVPSLRRVLNLTGTVLHTNLGRAALPQEATAEVVEVARGASNLEFDLGAGRRGDRDAHLEADIVRLTGAEAATVVNNNAAAVMLVLNTLALGKGVPVSRGELVEIGGSFRIPEILTRSGAKLVEVGTTNRTHLKDFAAAIGPDTALVMKVHASNYVIEGFTAAVPERELAALAHKHGIPFVIDLGSGTLLDLERFGLPHEPTPMEAMEAGADIVTFSGDKLLGGPQAGIIVGRKDLVAKIKSNPMKRALRCDKMTIAALSAVLRLYANPDRLPERLPTLKALTRPVDDIRASAERLLPAVSRIFEGVADVAVAPCESVIGSGALPTRTIASAGLAITPRREADKSRGLMPRHIADALLKLPVPIIGRLNNNAVVLDLRCLDDEAGFLADIERLALSR
ncbi:MAG: L-seryl-tRNA(Sec) selenium transferase [Hyphomicrobiaceae bacterium]